MSWLIKRNKGGQITTSVVAKSLRDVVPDAPPPARPSSAKIYPPKDGSVCIYHIPLELYLYMYEVCGEEILYKLATCGKYFKYVVCRDVDKLMFGQYIHTRNIRAKWKHSPVLIDTSVMGSGKTYTTVDIAVKEDLTLFVICEPSIKGNWEKVFAYFGYNKGYIETYNRLSLASKNPFIYKTDDGYQVGEGFKVIANNKLVMVLDESDNVKNNSGKNKSIRTLYIYGKEKGARMLCLSATPLDKQENVINIARVFGWVTKDVVARNDIQDGYVLEGLGEFIEALPLSYQEQNRIKASITPKNKYDVIFELFIRYMKPRICLAMPPPVIYAKLVARNGYYNIPPERDEELGEYINKLSQGIRAINDDNPNHNNDGWGTVDYALQGIEMIKADVMIRLARRVLSRQTTAKVVLVFYHIEPIQYAYDNLIKSYKGIMLTGSSCKPGDRQTLVDKFNNDDEIRFIILNLQVGAKGISLHDRTGNRPRWLLIVPNYRIILMHQVVYRVYRVGTLSDPQVRFIYCKASTEETHLIDKLSRKSNTMKAMNDEKLKDVKYPAEYQNFIEEDE